jgi:hypothetical protein
MPDYSDPLNTGAGKYTAAEKGDDGGGTNRWHFWTRSAQIGDLDDAAVTNPASDGSVIALLKGLISSMGVGTGTPAKNEDAVHASGDTGTFILGIRRDTAVSDAAAGDYHGLHVDALGKLRTTGTQLEDAVAASGDDGKFILAIRRDTQTSDAAAGDYHGLHVDANGRLRTADRNECSVAKVSALDNDLVVKASAGKLFGFAGYTTTAQYIQIHNAASAPSDGAVPELPFPVEANKPFSFWLPTPHPCATGIYLCNSTSGATKTLGGNDTWITAWYE